VRGYPILAASPAGVQKTREVIAVLEQSEKQLLDNGKLSYQK